MASYLENLSFGTDVIASRGYDLYQSGAVLSLSKEGNRVQAVVEGSSGTYSVFLGFGADGKSLIRYSCSCPYSHFCKHVAATLYALDAKEKAEASLSSFPSEGPELRFARLLDQYFLYGEGFLGPLSNAFLKEVLDTKEEGRLPLIEKRLRAVFSKGVTQSCAPYKKAVEALLKTYSFSPSEKELLVRSFLDDKDVLIRNVAFEFFLRNKGTELLSERLFVSLYEKDKGAALSLLNAVREVGAGKHEKAFLHIIYEERPSIANPELSSSLLREDYVTKDVSMLAAVLRNIYSNERAGALTHALTKTLYEEDPAKGEALLSFVLHRSRTPEDALAFLAFVPMESFRNLVAKENYFREIRSMAIIPFLLNVKATSEPLPFELWKARQYLQGESLKKGQEICLHYLNGNALNGQYEDYCAALLFVGDKETLKAFEKTPAYERISRLFPSLLKAVSYNLGAYPEGALFLDGGDDVSL